MKVLKNSIYIILVLSTLSFSANAQKSKATILLSDGKVLSGFAKLKGEDKVVFRKAKKAKRQEYDFYMIDTLKIYQKEKAIIYTKVKVKDLKEPKVLEIVATGKNATFFRKISSHYSPGIPMADGYGGGAMPSMYSIASAYVKKTGEEEAVYLGNNQLFSKNFKKAASDFFEDCPALVTKIGNREYTKKDLKEIIEFYNNDCN